jgi:2-methylisocitrate lyase-like PEP mutase family enzyme
MNVKKFRTLHQQATALFICNVWDVASAKTAEKLGFNAIGTSSAAIASMLGYEDGEEMSFEELLFIVKRIAACCDLPLTVDIEAGYSDDPLMTADYIKALAEVGVVGINIEDSKVKGVRRLLDADIFADYLLKIKQKLSQQQIDIFINVRTDTFLLGGENALSETQKRASLYQNTGADGLFVPCITNVDDIQAIVSAIKLPINVMCMPDLPDFDVLSTLGVKRISMGNFLFDKLQSDFEVTLKNIVDKNGFSSLFK